MDKLQAMGFNEQERRAIIKLAEMPGPWPPASLFDLAQFIANERAKGELQRLATFTLKEGDNAP